MKHRHNPFSTARVRPGALPFLGQPTVLEEALQRLQAAGWRGQIVGPHGSGKSTLARALLKSGKLQLVRLNSIIIRRHNRSPWPGRISVDLDRMDNSLQWRPPANRRLVLIDGVERLSFLHRWLLIHHCRRNRIGLILTSHRRLAGLPVVATMKPTPEILHRIVDHVLSNSNTDNTWIPDRGSIESVFFQHRGDLRESLMTLYDRFERSNGPVGCHGTATQT